MSLDIMRERKKKNAIIIHFNEFVACIIKTVQMETTETDRGREIVRHSGCCFFVFLVVVCETMLVR